MHRNITFVFGIVMTLAMNMMACQPATASDISILQTIDLDSGAVVSGFDTSGVILYQMTAATTITIHLTVRQNQGPRTNSVIAVTDHLPKGMLFISGAGPGVECTAEGQDITCLTFAALAGGQSKEINLEIALDPRLSGRIDNAVQVAYAGDTYQPNNRAIAQLEVGVPVFETQDLDFAKSRTEGAMFLVNEIRNEHCIHLGVTDWADPTWDNDIPDNAPEIVRWDITNGRHAGIEIVAYCAGAQGEAFVEAFGSFELKNGWIVKSYSQDDYNWGDVDFDLDVAPGVGKCHPILKAHIRTRGTTLRQGMHVGTGVWTAIRIVIEGPSGTNPYHGLPSVFCEE